MPLVLDCHAFARVCLTQITDFNTPKQLLGATRCGHWKPRIDLQRGVREVYKWFTEESNYAQR
jgi:hypothetical protein